MKYSLPTGEVIDLDIDDILDIDFTTVRGKETLQTIYSMKDRIKKYSDFDEAIHNDSLKFFDKEKKILEDGFEEELDQEENEEDFEKSSLYFEQRKQQEEED